MPVPGYGNLPGTISRKGTFQVAEKKRDRAYYADQYKRYEGTPEGIAARSQRNKARALMEKKVGKAAIAGKDIDHKHPIRSGGGNSESNLRVRSVAANRGDTGKGKGKGKGK